ncbi:MAG: creatininase family protein, partial [Tindallia sp. MSAO_Bac2]
GTVSAPEYKDLKDGVVGDPTLATKEKGDKYVDAIVEKMVALVESIKKDYPAGTKIETN